MSLKNQLTEDMKQAMRDRDSFKLGTIRFLLADIKNVEIDQGELDEAGVQKVIAKQIKQMKDAMEQFAQGGRDDLQEEEGKKVAILEAYLPQQMSDEELRSIVSQVLEENEGGNMGQVIGQVMGKAQGKADGSRVSKMVQELM